MRRSQLEEEKLPPHRNLWWVQVWVLLAKILPQGKSQVESHLS
jgi:hypothetical protein